MLSGPLFTESYVLVYWADEESTSVVRQTSVIAPPPAKQAVGSVCTVKVGGMKCDGRITGIGKFMVHLYITPFAYYDT